MRRRVEKYLACGMAQDQIAQAIGCAPNTFAKHFAAEIRTGAARRKAEAIDLLWRQAKAGNASALRRLLDMIHIAELAGRAANPKGAAPPPPAAAKKPARLGKKAAAQLAAETAGQGSAWGEDLDVPDGAVVN